jgi:thiamine transport system permease protein
MDRNLDRSRIKIKIPLKKLTQGGILWVAPIAFLGIFYFFPLGNILYISLTRDNVGFAAPFLEAITSPTIRGVLWFTIWQAALSTAITLLVGLPGAYLFARYDFRGKSLFRALTGIPFVLPTLVVATAFYALLGPRGWINIGLMEIFDLASPPIHFVNTLAAILVAHVFYNTTIVLRLVGDFWSRVDPRLAQAARTLGANQIQTLFRITLPILFPAIITAALLIFIFDFTSFGVILILGGPRYATLEVEIYYQTISLFNLPLAATLSIIQLLCTLALTILYTRLIGGISRPISLRSQQITQRKLTTIRSRLFAGVVIFSLLSLLILPLISLMLRSVTHFEVNRSQSGIVDEGFTLDYYKELSQNPRRTFFYATPLKTIGISLSYAAATVIIALALGIPASWALAKENNSIISKALDPIVMLPLGTSAVTLGLGFIVALDQPPFDLRTSPILVPLAHTLVAFPFVVRSLTPALQSIKPHLRDAAAVLGASPGEVFRYIDLPMIGRAVFVAAVFAFTISIGEFGATALISRPEYPTVPIAIYRFISQPGQLNYGQALALSTILMVITGVGMVAIEHFRIADIGEF